MILLLTAHTTLRAASQAAANGEGIAATTELLDSSSAGVRFRLNSPIPVNGTNADVAIPGLNSGVAEPGAPALPAYSTFIALPPGATADVEVVVAAVSTLQAPARVAPVPGKGDLAPDEVLAALYAQVGEPSSAEAPHIYERDALFPGVNYRLSEPMYFRDLRLVRLELFPLQYNPVRGTIQHAPTLEVNVTFHNADWSELRPVAGGGSYLESIASLVLNFDQAYGWRSLPAAADAPGMTLPLNRDAFKIAVKEDGIYELSYEALAAAGMNVGDVNPNSFEMMYRGEPVAYRFVGDNDPDFEPGEKIRFYGWAFDGSRLERQFLTENVFWLWADGTARRMSTVASSLAHPAAPSFRESSTREPEIAFTHVWTDDWEDSPNEPDAWVWDRVQKRPVAEDWPSVERAYEITLPVPAAAGAQAQVTVEILSRESRPDHHVSIYLNGNEAVSGQLQWTGARSVNVTMSVPANQLLAGANQVHVVYQTPVTTSQDTTIRTPALYYMNRITVDYDRQFVASGDQLLFADDDGRSRYQVTGLPGGDIADAIVWELSDRLNPKVVSNVDGANLSSLSFGTNAASAAFIATHEGNVRQPARISKYVAPNLDPPQGASWLAISYGDFMAQARTLAAHRERGLAGGYRSHVVDIRHIINQYGYGLPLPDAIRHYLQHALAEWPVAPQHLLLFGDGHINPRQLPCNEGNTQCSHWATTPETNFVPVDIVFTDQFVGLNASDYRYSLLVGDDLLPDITVGRLPVQSAAEATNAVNKIIHFETVRLTDGAWQHRALFVADNQDHAGDFLGASEAIAAEISPPFTTQVISMTSGTIDVVNEARALIREAINNPPESGATFLNYRGHGAVRSWAGNLINLDDPDDAWDPWLNNEPLIILSMDCLDGHFAQPGVEALSEVFMSVPTYGSVAHWSSSGFGFDQQHGPLHHSFYDGLLNHDLTAIGDAINHAKLSYFMLSLHPSQLYSFILQGDPAMELGGPVLDYDLFLPALSG